MTTPNSSRDVILSDIARALAQPVSNSDAIAAEARALIGDPDAARPALLDKSCVESFMARVAGPKVGATIDRIGTIGDLPAAVARFLAGSGNGRLVAIQPTFMLTGLDWHGSGIGLTDTIDDCVVVGLATWGIAETGSLVFHSASDMPVLYNFLGAVHIVAVHAGGIVAHLEDYAVAARIAGDPAPRNVCLITGASGTTDIEGSLVKGAHGPRHLHVILIGEAAGR